MEVLGVTKLRQNAFFDVLTEIGEVGLIIKLGQKADMEIKDNKGINWIRIKYSENQYCNRKNSKV